MLNKIIIVFLFICFYSCKKYETEIISGNNSPVDSTISSVTVENYINKVYITTLARKPGEEEFNAALSLLNSNKVSVTSRKIFLDSVVANPEYSENLYKIARADLLENIDTMDIRLRLDLLEREVVKPEYSEVAKDFFRNEIARLEKLQSLPDELKAGTINVIEMHKRCTNNYFYDQLNMGSANFSISIFQHFLFRYPTDEELMMDTLMYNGRNGVLFGKNGSSKDDLINIFFESDEYFEGQVRNLFNKYLYKEPSSYEMSSLAAKYKSEKNYKELQKEILASDEYLNKK